VSNSCCILCNLVMTSCAAAVCGVVIDGVHCAMQRLCIVGARSGEVMRATCSLCNWMQDILSQVVGWGGG
jgi:hypothetical protein